MDPQPGAGPHPAFIAHIFFPQPPTSQRGHHARDKRALRRVCSGRARRTRARADRPRPPTPSAHNAPSREPWAAPAQRAGDGAGAPRTRTRTARRRAPSGGHRAGAGTMEGGAYGAGKAGGAFDPHTLVRQPHTILRVVSWVSTSGWPCQAKGGVGARARAARPGGPRPHRTPGRALAAGGERSYRVLVPAPPSFPGPEGRGLDAREGRPLPLPGACFPAPPVRALLPSLPRPAIAVTSRPRGPAARGSGCARPLGRAGDREDGAQVSSGLF